MKLRLCGGNFGSLGWWLVYVDVTVLAGTTKPLMMFHFHHPQCRVESYTRKTTNTVFIFYFYVLLVQGGGVDCRVYISSLFC